MRLLLIPLLFLAGCNPHNLPSEPMTTEEMGKAVAECKKHGLVPDTWRNRHFQIVMITCKPERNK